MITLFVPFLTLAVQAPTSLTEGLRALKAFEVEAAVTNLNEALQTPPHGLADHILIYEGLGIANAYLERNEEALTAFQMMIAMDPYRSLSYGISPKATLVFERARQKMRDLGVLFIDVQTPPDPKVGDELVLSLQVLSDPLSLVRSGQVLYRVSSEGEFHSTEIAALGAGKSTPFTLRLAKLDGPQTIQFFVRGLDSSGSEVALVNTAERPRDLRLRVADQEKPSILKSRVFLTVAATVLAGVGVSSYYYVTTVRDPGGSFRSALGSLVP